MSRANSFIINTDYNPLIVGTILRRFWWWALLIIGVLGIAAFLYLRYTKPIYESSMVIQLEEKDQGKELLEIENINTKDNISSELELLRSQFLFDMALDKLNMNVSVFSKGNILTEEKYHQSSFNVIPYSLKDSSLCDVPIYVEVKGGKLQISYTHNGKEKKSLHAVNKRFSTPEFEILIQVEDWERIKKDDEQNDLYFIFNNKSSIVARLIPNLEIEAVDVDAKSISIKYRGYNPELCHDISNAVAETFFEYDEVMKRRSSDNILLFIDKQLDSIMEEVELSENNLTEFQRDSKLSDPEGAGEKINENLDKYQDQLFELEEEIATLRLIANKLNNDPNRLELYKVIPEMLGKSYEEALTRQINDLNELLEKKEMLLSDVSENHSEVRSVTTRIQSKIQSIRRSVDVINERLTTKARALRTKLGIYDSEFIQLPERKMEYNRLKSLQELNEKYYQLLTDKKVLYSISNAGYTSENRILNPPTISSEPVSPNRKLIYSGFIFVGFIIAFTVLLFKYVTYNEVNTDEDLKQLLPEKASFLGNIPLIRNAEEFSQLMVIESPKSSLAESLRNIRTNLSFVNPNAKTIAISSSISGEGKTFVALNLAGILALSGKKTVIIDLDLRKPKIHLGLNVPNTQGISNLIIGQCTVEETIRKSSVEGLDFITAGPIPPNPSELILSGAFKEVLEELKSMYDIVIIDNPPVGLVTDGVQILANADVPIYVFKSGYSKRIFANRVKELFDMNQLNHLNVILNGTNFRRSSYGYGYGYGYGYYEEKKSRKSKKK